MTSDTHTLVIKRVFAAPRELVWQAWTEGEHLNKWSCPMQFTMVSGETNLQVGGSWKCGMRSPEGRDYVAGGEYREISPVHRLVFTHSWERENGRSTETLVTITLEESHGKTTMTFEQSGFADARTRDDHGQGWGSAFENLAGHLATVPSDEREIVISRVFDAPRKLVWDVWTQPEHVANWFGPRGFSTRVEEATLQVGGKWVYVMIGPDGTEYPCHGYYQVFEPEERIVSTDEFGDGGENSHPGADLPQGIVVTELFEDVGSKTRVTIRIMHPDIESKNKHAAMGVVEGWGSSLDCLEEHLAQVQLAQVQSADTADREVVISRVFDAPAELLFQAWTAHEHLANWFGPNGFTITTHEMSFQPNGQWRFIMHGPDGTDFPNLITYREIVPAQRIVYDQGDNTNPAMFRTTVTFATQGQQTELTLHSIFPTKEARDFVVDNYGAIEGGHQTLARLAEYVATL